MRGGSIAALALAGALATGTARVSAHRLDEYLHAARIAIDPEGVHVELGLTPGVTVADAVIREIDGNSDGVLSPAERAAYAQRITRALSLRVDDARVAFTLAGSSFPDAAALRGGDAPITLRLDALLPRLPAGAHRVAFRNANSTHGAVYLANALLPDDDRVAITGLTHAIDQSSLAVAFTVRATTRAWWTPW